MAEVAEAGEDDTIVEVGVGEGVLTEALAERCQSVLAHEIDPRLVKRVKTRLRDVGNVEPAHGYFLESRPPADPFKVVANIPYGITSPIVDWCLNAPELRSAILMTQLEYARKRSGWYGRWSQRTIETWPGFAWRLHDRIEREYFRPMPKVDSGILHIVRRREPLIATDDVATYRRMVAIGFTGRGGSLHESLSREHSRRKVAAIFDRIGLPTATIVAFAAPAHWITIFKQLFSDQHKPGNKNDRRECSSPSKAPGRRPRKPGPSGGPSHRRRRR